MGSESPVTCVQASLDDRAARYVAAELSETERDAFEEHFLACAACRAAVEAHLDLADALRVGAAATPKAAPAPRLRGAAASPGARWPGLAAAAVLVVGVAGYLGGRHSAEQRFQAERDALAGSARQLQEQLSRSRAEQEALRADRDREHAARTATSFALSPGRERGESSTPSLTVARSVTDVQFELDLATVRAYPSFRAELHGASDDLVWSESRVRATGADGEKTVALRIPAAVLGDGNYEIVLRGLTEQGAPETAATYAFRVRRR